MSGDVRRGEIWWCDFVEPVGSRPGKRRPVLVVSSDAFNATGLATVIVAVITSNLRLERLPGNTLITSIASGLPRDSVVNGSALATVNRWELFGRVGSLPSDLLRTVDRNLRVVLAL